ncbi:MAG: ABC transporter ATP-binding protein [Bacteroidota bacterium]
MSATKLLEIIDLQTQFQTEEGTVKAVDRINFCLYRGETLGIVGESGSGKSVTSLSIMRLVPQPAGRIVGGQILYHPGGDRPPIDLLRLPEKEMRPLRGKDLAMIFQEPMSSLNPVFTCGSQVLEAIQLHQRLDRTRARQLVLDLFARVQLPDPERIYAAYPHQISGGQKQRVMIAMAMSCQPQVLIADEPTTALDVTVQKAILDLMSDLKREMEAAIVFITHDLGVIADIADRVVVMYQGRIVEQGPVRDIFLRPQHAYTKSLLACRPPVDQALRRLPVVRDFIDWREVDGQRTMVERAVSVKQTLAQHQLTEAEVEARRTRIQSGEPLLRVVDLRTWFPKGRSWWGRPQEFVKAVDGVSFEVYPGETMGLVGESGCGKTTLGRSILRLNRTRSGEVWYRGKNLLSLNATELKDLRKEVQIIFQDPYSSLNPRMTIGKAIEEPLLVHGILGKAVERRERVLELLATVDLRPEHYQRYPHEFSGGQRQRICIARALALNPKFIICDESVSALDVSVQAQVLNLLLELREKYQLTYIFISHDLSVVKFMSDRMIVMNGGKIEEMGWPEDIYQKPQQAYTRRLIEAIPRGLIRDDGF